MSDLVKILFLVLSDLVLSKDSVVSGGFALHIFDYVVFEYVKHLLHQLHARVLYLWNIIMVHLSRVLLSVVVRSIRK